MVVTNSKWVATAASIWIQCSSGSLYTFGIYSPVLKLTQSYDQSTLDTVAAFKDLGANAGLLSGLLYSSAVSSADDQSSSSAAFLRPGPWVVLAAGAFQSFAGYFPIWLAVVGAIPPPPVPAMCFFMLLAAHAQTFFNTADVVTAVHNFPDYGGTSVGIMKGFLGLSGAILIQVYKTVFKDKPTSFLLMLALLPTFNPLMFMYFVGIYHRKEGDEKKHLNNFSLVAIIIALYLMVIIIWQNVIMFPDWAYIFTCVMLCLLLVSPLFIVFKAQKDTTGISQALVTERDKLLGDSGQLEDQCLPGETDHDTEINLKHTGQWRGNHNLSQALCSADFWLLIIGMACGMGSGLATVNNISQIGGSLGYTSMEISTLVSLWSIWNFMGRFGAGYVSDFFLHRRGWARPLFMAVTLATMSIGHTVIASGVPGALYFGSVLVGVCYGSQWSLMPTITSEIFGIQHMATIFNTITIAGPVGSYIFSARVAGYIYDQEASAEGKNTCYGTHCFFLSFIIMASATLLGSLAALGLFFRTRNFYRLVILRRLQHSVK